MRTTETPITSECLDCARFARDCEGVSHAAALYADLDNLPCHEPLDRPAAHEEEERCFTYA